jgi:Kef-type K+ transport system membrane component KefB
MIDFIPSNIEFQLSLLLFVSLAGYLIASKINQSAIVWEIFIGILIGPSLLGLITYTDSVQSFAQLGAVVLLFVVGLEFKVKDVFTAKYGVIALTGVLLPWFSGYFLAVLFGFDFANSVFIGTALTATSVAITANVLREMGKLDTDAAKTIIGVAVIDDVFGLLFLSFSVEITTSTFSITSILVVIVEAALFMGIGLFIGNRFLCGVIEKFDKTKLAKKFPETVFIFAMMIAFIYSMFAEVIGLSAIVGAFLAGVALADVTVEEGKDFKEGAEYLQILFAAVFFVSLGILADFHAFSIDIIWFLLFLTLIAFVTKILGTYIGARLVKIPHKTSFIASIGMVPRGEVAMIVALLGLNMGIIHQNVYISIIIMSLITTAVIPFFLRVYFKK